MQSTTASAHPDWPSILNRYVSEVAPDDKEQVPRRTMRRYHNLDVPVWQGRLHIDDVEGWVENIRLKHYLRRWQARRSDFSRRPTTEEIYEIMLEADREEPSQSKKPFHLERIAENIAANGVQEPIFVFAGSNSRGTLWDGNRRRYGSHHIMVTPELANFRAQARWLPAYVYLPSGDPEKDAQVKRAVLNELNFREKDHIPWPAYVKAGEVHADYQRLVALDPTDPTLRREVREKLALQYGLKGWRQADRWIKMFELASQFKEYQEEEHDREETVVELKIQDRFEYFDELSKPGVWGVLKEDPDARDEVFNWLWDDKFKAFADVRSVPKILTDPVARAQANSDDANGVKRAIETVIANDPVRVKDKTAANLKIKQFAQWLDSFKREDFRQLNPESLTFLITVLTDVTRMLQGLQASGAAAGTGESEHAQPS